MGRDKTVLLKPEGYIQWNRDCFSKLHESGAPRRRGSWLGSLEVERHPPLIMATLQLENFRMLLSINFI